MSTDQHGDGQCTWAPDRALTGESLTACCVEHDWSDFTLSDDWTLARCIIEIADNPISAIVLVVTALVYFVAVRVYRIIHRLVSRA